MYVRGFDKTTQEAGLMEEKKIELKKKREKNKRMKSGVFGEIESVKIVSSRKYPFVCFYTYDSAVKACQWSYLVESEHLHCEIVCGRGKVVKKCPFQPLPFDDL